MKLVYIIFGILILIAAAFIVWRLLHDPNTKSVREPESTPANTTIRSDSPYADLRSRALNFPSNEFGVDQNSEIPVVYGIVMDWKIGSGIVTIASFSSGDASMYTSSGGGVIGGIGHESVKDAAKDLVTKAQGFVSKATKSEDISFPQGSDDVKFFILTNRGRFMGSEELENFDNGSSKWLDLFVEANRVISELREISEEQQK